jgi:hypothetical protein
MLKSTEIDYERLKKEQTRLGEEDSDRWMDMTPESLDTLLQKQFLGQNPEEGFKEMASSIPDAMKAFVEHEAGLKGAEIPSRPPRRSKTRPSKKGSKDRTSSASGTGTGSNRSSGPSKISFDAESFGETLSSILTLKVPQTDSDASSSSGMSDYNSEDLDTEEDEEDEEDELNVMTNNKAKNGIKRGKKGKGNGSESGSDFIQGMKNYMEQMDRELSKTDVGKSFERESKRPPLATFEEDMDGDDEEEGDDDYKPVDVDLNALKNILESYTSQSGSAGPSGNLLASMGIHLPRNSDTNNKPCP